jgi:hypothetical protein
MDSVLESLGRYAASLGKRLWSIVLALVVGGVMLVGSTFFIHISVILTLLGCTAGLLWFVAGYIIWHSGLPANLHDQLNLRENWAVSKRRWLVAWITLGWFTILGFAGGHIPNTILGALNVAIVLTLWRIATMTAAERILYEETQDDPLWPEPDDDEEYEEQNPFEDRQPEE